MHAFVQPTPELKGEIQALSSKNYTTRYMLAAALAEGTSRIYYPAHSEDSEAMRRCLRDLGAVLDEKDHILTIQGFGSKPAQIKKLNVGNAGAVLRFLMSVAAFCEDVTFVNTYPESLGKRPHDDLIAALEQMNVEVQHQGGKLPITIKGGSPIGGHIRVSGEVSSQYLSSLLFMTPLLQEDSVIEVTGDLKSKVVVGQTLEVLEQAGIQIDAQPDLMRFVVKGGQAYQPREYTVQGDYPGSAAVLAAAAVTHSDVKIHRLLEESKQGERAVIDVLKAMGVPLTHQEGTVHVRGNQSLKAVEFDGDAFTDAVLAMVAASVFAEGTSRFYNVENLRYKECDRITDFLTELKKAGADVEERKSEIIVHGKPEGVEGGVTIDAHFDHRVIMALSVVALRSKKGLTIQDAHHVAKSYPQFFDHMKALGANIETQLKVFGKMKAGYYVIQSIKTTFLLAVMAGLVLSSALFTVLLYAKATGKWDELMTAHAVEENDVIENHDPLLAELELQTIEENMPADPSANMIEHNLEPVPYTKNQSAMLDAPLILQYPELPRGCELTSLTMLFQYYGIDKDKMDLLPELKRDDTPIQWKNGKIVYWGHPNDGFVGDITLNSSGFGIYHEALFELLDKYIDNAVDLTGESFSVLEAQVSNGFPVVAWTTTDYKEPAIWMEWDSPSGKVKTTVKEHAVLLVGYDEDYVYVNDPLKATPNFKVPKDQFIESWEAMGKQALSYVEDK